jgi:hypothetical protein
MKRTIRPTNSSYPNYNKANHSIGFIFITITKISQMRDTHKYNAKVSF